MITEVPNAENSHDEIDLAEVMERIRARGRVNRKLERIESEETGRQAVLLKKPVGFLKMSDKHAHDDGPAIPKISKEPTT